MFLTYLRICKYSIYKTQINKSSQDSYVHENHKILRIPIDISRYFNIRCKNPLGFMF